MSSRTRILFIASLVLIEYIFSSKIVFGIRPHLALLALIVLSQGMTRQAVLFAAILSGYLADVLLAEDNFNLLLAYILFGLLALITKDTLQTRDYRRPSIIRIILLITSYESALAIMSPTIYLASWIPYVLTQIVVSIVIILVWVEGAQLIEKKL